MTADGYQRIRAQFGRGQGSKKYPALSRATDRRRRPTMYLDRLGAVQVGGWSMRPKTNETWRIKAESAWRMAAQCAVLAQEADETEEREYYIRMRDAWIGLANRCEFLVLPEISERPRASSKPRRQKVQPSLRTVLIDIDAGRAIWHRPLVRSSPHSGRLGRAVHSTRCATRRH